MGALMDSHCCKVVVTEGVAAFCIGRKLEISWIQRKFLVRAMREAVEIPGEERGFAGVERKMKRRWIVVHTYEEDTLCEV